MGLVVTHRVPCTQQVKTESRREALELSWTQGGCGGGTQTQHSRDSVTLGGCFWLWRWARVLVPRILAKRREPQPGRSIGRTGGPGRESQPSLGSPVPRSPA